MSGICIIEVMTLMDVLRSLAQWSRASDAEFSNTRGEMNGRENMGQRSSNLDAAMGNMDSN